MQLFPPKLFGSWSLVGTLFGILFAVESDPENWDCSDEDLCSVPRNFYYRQERSIQQNSTIDIRELIKNKNRRLVLELAVFVDDALYKKFRDENRNSEAKAEAALQDFVFTIVQHAQTIFHVSTLYPQIDILFTHYEAWKTQPRLLQYAHHRADMTQYLPLFCQYQKRANRNWDHAVLLSGYDLLKGSETRFSGYATTDTMCTPYSCSLVEAQNFKSAYTLAHEIGHGLGMKHDSVGNNCDPTCCVMSPIVASGRHVWSHCSQQEYREFLHRLVERGTFCLLAPDGTIPLLNFDRAEIPGQKYTVDDQCRNYFGRCYKHVRRSSENLAEICSEAWCGNGGSYINASHAALEGTYCGPGRWCQAGHCVPADRHLHAVDGEWSSWGPLPGKACGETECSRCEIDGQLRIRPEMRVCNNPTPNNGGSDCEGAMFRAFACDHSPCDVGVSIDDYASKVCRRLQRDMPHHPKVHEFTGTGLQRTTSEDISCIVWCHLQHDYMVYTFFDPFPNGTPCDRDKYCINGHCLPVTEEPGRYYYYETEPISQATTATLPPPFINTIDDSNENSDEHVPSFPKALPTISTKRLKILHPSQKRMEWIPPPELKEQEFDSNYLPIIRLGQWSSWGSWSWCTKPCDGGTQTGIRRCFPQGTHCAGANTQTRVCNLRKC